VDLFLIIFVYPLFILADVVYLGVQELDGVLEHMLCVYGAIGLYLLALVYN
jgi:hypothetical protein